ncbi:hypothetical protein CRENBAI_010267 [Crenichthys baileyi]|uniref:Uncharacterized protein n=1 Tax=Crenichthys baileyi TaxID=28760 RepID=A0AAV9QTH5_9TELE
MFWSNCSGASVSSSEDHRHELDLATSQKSTQNRRCAAFILALTHTPAGTSEQATSTELVPQSWSHQTGPTELVPPNWSHSHRTPADFFSVDSRGFS